MGTNIDAFREQREKGQQRLLDADHLGIKRFLALDTGAYRDSTDDGGLPGDTKELLGLAASAVLRCDDCITYHIEQCVRAGLSARQITEALNIALVVGGSILIPHLRRAMLILDECIAERDAGA